MKRWIKTLLSFVLMISVVFPMQALVSAEWVKDSGSWAYVTANKKATGWKKIGNSWYYFNQSGKMLTGWQWINDSWYYFYAGGAMATGWKQIGGSWYYLTGSGAMKTGWLKQGNTWYYLNAGGKMATGWKKVGSNWYYLSGNGTIKTGWLYLGSKWYYFTGSGAMKTGWLKLNSDWYYLNPDGFMETDWIRLNGTYYYLLPDGKMVTGQQTINGIIYVFESDGKLLSDISSVTDATEYEQQVLKKVNQIRENTGLAPLSYSSLLSLAAEIRADEISVKFDHIRPDGTAWYTVFPEIGQSTDGTGENIARNYSTPSTVVQSWMDSSEHRQNILNRNFRYMGICYLKKASGEGYWVQLFANQLY